MIQIKKMVFNSFQVNTWLLSDETGDCIVIDAGCYEEKEKEELRNYLTGNRLRLVRNLNTHCHIDHILGNGFIFETYGIRPEYHRNSLPFFHTVSEIGSSFGYVVGRGPEAARFIEDNETIAWGNSSVKALFTPGHAEGSVCYYSSENKLVITGDVLFRDTIGRTDLPSGDFNRLMTSIKTRLFTLPDETLVLPGHGPDTTVGYERENNPFIR
jgi:glyoxylase-like metal-dependent hydrolase (beta-lactamase superfamily II)